MTAADFAAYVRQNARANSTTLPDAEVLIYLNAHWIELSHKIAEINEDIFGMVSTADLAAQREYPLPGDLVNALKAVEAKFDGTNWVRLLPFDLNLYNRTTDESTITNFFGNDQDEAYYDIYRRSLWIYSGTISAVTGGLKLWYYSYPAEITSLTDDVVDLAVDPTTTSHGIPKQFHKILGDLVSRDYKQNLDRPISLNEAEMNVDSRVEKALSAMRRANFDQEITGGLPGADKVGDNGFDY